jgi:putative photosynthetic complex assembly protein 2
MTSPWVAALVALFLWWASTGAILWRVRHADNEGADQHVWSALLGLPLLLGGFAGVSATVDDTSVRGAYLAFGSALAVWGWIELAFLSGVVTGPNRAPCPPGASLAERFVRAVGTIFWHELAILGMLAALAILSKGAEHAFAFWTFALLFFARVSAKLNLFLGVPQVNTHFLPSTLQHLPSHFRRGPMNWFFPVSVVALSFAAACWLERLHAATADGARVGFALLTALTLLALLEHWFMVLPLPDDRLWRWMIPAPKERTTTRLPNTRLPNTRLKEDANGL